MNEIKRESVAVPSSVRNSCSGKYRDNLLESTVSTGKYIIVREDLDLIGEVSSPHNIYYEVARNVKSVCLMTSYGRLSHIGKEYIEVPLWVDINPTITTSQGMLETFTFDNDDLNTLRGNGLSVNGVNINMNLSLLSDTKHLDEIHRTIIDSHKEGYLVSLKINSTVGDFKDVIRISTTLGADICILNPNITYNPESDKLDNYGIHVLFSDEGMIQSQSLFKAIEINIHSAGKGVALTQTLRNRSLEEATKFIRACSAIVHDDKDAEQAYDIFVM